MSHSNYAQLLKSICKENNVVFYCEEIEQDIMDKAFKNKSGIYSNKFTGVDLKVKFVLKMITKFHGQNILYLDCTSFIRNFPKYTQSVDMIFPHEKVFDSTKSDYGVNIGVIGLKCNERTHRFWSSVDKLIQNGGWDQGIVNILLGTGDNLIYKDSFSKIEQDKIKNTEYFPSWDFFDRNKVNISANLSDLKKDACIYKFIGDYKIKEAMFKHLCKLYRI